MRFHTQLGLFITILIAMSSACKNKHAELILTNGIIHTMDPQGSIVQACAIQDGKIVATGRTEDLLFAYQSDSIVDLRGGQVFPGLIDAHCHFYGYAINQEQANLFGTTSWEECVALIEEFSKAHPTEWVLGRGWDQTKWPKQLFPDKKLLDEKFPNTPVFLRRIGGHTAIANSKALELAGITEKTKLSGGQLFKKNGRLTGVLLDNAMDLVDKIIPKPTDADITRLLLQAEQKLFAVGLTTVDDAGLDQHIIHLIDSLQRIGKLQIRVYAMANPSPENFERYLKSGPYQTERLSVRCFKIYVDGDLGSRGACMLRPYKDDPGNYGLILTDPDSIRSWAAQLYEAGFQMATHCIGDSANRMVLRIYGEVLKGHNDRRWRIEHCQVVDTNDFAKFGEFNIWPSVQPIHAMSDRKWSEDRVGKERMKGAYAYKTLFMQNNTFAFGSDFPVEDINPILGYHAAVARVDLEDNPYGGFRKEEAVGRDTALRAMTIWAAASNFEENVKGSIEVGKFADLVVLRQDLATMPEKQIPYVRIQYTILNGKIVFSGAN
jgi:predicted amidohydrolase YtcJ